MMDRKGNENLTPAIPFYPHNANNFLKLGKSIKYIKKQTQYLSYAGCINWFYTAYLRSVYVLVMIDWS
ncbi:MAG: hypothetical protein JWQ38_2177 [Flavipsychrobacter sp.]|nr:hypothetical protein [Flavipsychrobacter sp.]